MNILDKIGVIIHRFTGDIEGQNADLKKMTGELAASPRGTIEEANAFCAVEDQAQFILTGKGMNSKEYVGCFQGMRQFQTAAQLWNRGAP